MGSVNHTSDQPDEIYQSLEKLANRIRLIYGAEVDIERFSSTAIMLDIRYQDKLFVIAYSPNYGFGVDEVKEGDAFTASYGFNTNDINLAIHKIYRLIEQE